MYVGFFFPFLRMRKYINWKEKGGRPKAARRRQREMDSGSRVAKRENQPGEGRILEAEGGGRQGGSVVLAPPRPGRF